MGAYRRAGVQVSARTSAKAAAEAAAEAAAVEPEAVEMVETVEVE